MCSQPSGRSRAMPLLPLQHLIECYDLSQNPPVPKDGGPCGPGSKGICADGDCVVRAPHNETRRGVFVSVPLRLFTRQRCRHTPNAGLRCRVL